MEINNTEDVEQALDEYRRLVVEHTEMKCHREELTTRMNEWVDHISALEGEILDFARRNGPPRTEVKHA